MCQRASWLLGPIKALTHKSVIELCRLMVAHGMMYTSYHCTTLTEPAEAQMICAANPQLSSLMQCKQRL
jgi:hypothetical protein